MSWKELVPTGGKYTKADFEILIGKRVKITAEDWTGKTHTYDEFVDRCDQGREEEKKNKTQNSAQTQNPAPQENTA